jgi:serine/threonine-protein kinase RsbW
LAVSSHSKSLDHSILAAGHVYTIHEADQKAGRAIESLFEIPSVVALIAPTVDKIVAKIRRARCIPGKEDDTSGALFEALANAVLHGNHEDPAKRVRVRLHYEPRKCLSIVVSDEGPGFTVSEVADPTRPENLDADHGRGILLMRAFMDEVHFEKGGSECHLVKHCDISQSRTLLGRIGSDISSFFRSLLYRRIG